MLTWLKQRWYAMRKNKALDTVAMSEGELVWRVQEMGRAIDAMRDQRKQFSDELRARLGGS